MRCKSTILGLGGPALRAWLPKLDSPTNQRIALPDIAMATRAEVWAQALWCPTRRAIWRAVVIRHLTHTQLIHAHVGFDLVDHTRALAVGQSNIGASFLLLY